MDWSDDVGYSVHDVEDAVASRRFDLSALRSPTQIDAIAAVARQHYAPDLQLAALVEAMDRLLATGCIPAVHTGSRTDLAALKDMTSRLIGRFVRSVEAATRARHGAGSLTRYGADLVIPDEARAECAMLKAVAAHFVMFADERQSLMGDQRDLVHDLVAAYREKPERLDPLYWHDFESVDDDDARLRVIVDQVASLSDPRAIALHHEWS